MSKLRSINTSIWTDTWFEGLEPEEKLLFIYLITNDKTNMLGVYETSLRKVSFETGILLKNVEKYISKFEKEGKVRYASNRIILLKFLKHQNYNGNMKKSAVRCYNELPIELKSIKTGNLEENDKGFETLTKGFEMVRKVEYEFEAEGELEEETEGEEKDKLINILMSEIKISDVPENEMEYFNIANSFYLLFKRNSEEVLKVKWSHLDKTKYKKCINPIRLLLTNDNRTIEELQSVYKFLQTDSFWMGNIQTTEKLREKFDQLITKTSSVILNNLNNGTNNKTQPTADEKLNARKAANRERLMGKFGIVSEQTEL